MTRLTYALFQLFSTLALRLARDLRAPGERTWRVVVVETITSEARIRAYDEAGLWRQISFDPKDTPFVQLSREFVDITLEEESAP